MLSDTKISVLYLKGVVIVMHSCHAVLQEFSAYTFSSVSKAPVMPFGSSWVKQDGETSRAKHGIGLDINALQPQAQLISNLQITSG